MCSRLRCRSFINRLGRICDSASVKSAPGHLPMDTPCVSLAVNLHCRPRHTCPSRGQCHPSGITTSPYLSYSSPRPSRQDRCDLLCNNLLFRRYTGLQMSEDLYPMQVCRSLRYSGTSVPPGHEAACQRAIWTFRHQRVWSEVEGRMVHLTPLPEAGLQLPSAAAGAASGSQEGSQPLVDEALDFLGPLLPDHLARSIAEGGNDAHVQQTGPSIMPALRQRAAVRMVPDCLEGQHDQQACLCIKSPRLSPGDMLLHLGSLTIPWEPFYSTVS